MTANELADELDLRRNLLMGKEHELGARAILLYGHSADMLCEQQTEIEKLGSELDRIVELYTDKAIENEALKKARCVACGWNPNLIGGEKIACNKCNDTGWVCEWHPDKEAHMCCGRAGMPCECTKGEA